MDVPRKKPGITRRDLINGVTLAAGLGGVGLDPLTRTALAVEQEWTPRPGTYYPPKWTGLRGSHPGAFERAHELAWEDREDWGDVVDTGETYDLVVVGAGASGLTAAYTYQTMAEWEASVLLLDNHDDFGGHAKRNEFEHAGQMRMTYAGSQSFDNIANWPDEMWALMDDLGISLEDFETKHYQHDWFQKHGLAAQTFLDEAHWGANHWLPADLGRLVDVVPGAAKSTKGGPLDFSELFAAAPLSQTAKDELTMLFSEEGGDEVAREADNDLSDIESYPYETFLQEYWEVSDPETFRILRKLPADENGVGAETLSLSEACYAMLPGTKHMGELYEIRPPELPPGDPGYCHHFPDGNAGFCRMMVRAMIPNVAPKEESAESVVLAPFDYQALDDPENETRLRLNSTVISVKHEGDPETAETVSVIYIKDGKPHRVTAKHVVLACWNMIIPHICRDLPLAQKDALASNVKIPYVFANVMVKNWKALKAAKVAAAYCPTNYFHILQTEYPVSMGGYDPVASEDEAMPLTLIRVPLPDDATGMTPREQFRAGRHEILATSFEDYEAEVKAQLNAMFGAFGFEADRDIAALTVNRWPHGYSYTYFSLFDKGASIEDGPHITARQRFGRIAIANSDAGADSWLDVAAVQAMRAVRELMDG